MGGERVIVGDEEEATRIVLHLDEIFQRPEVVSEVEPAGGAYSAKNCFHCLLYLLNRKDTHFLQFAGS
jgi:hypothetical protein